MLLGRGRRGGDRVNGSVLTTEYLVGKGGHAEASRRRRASVEALTSSLIRINHSVEPEASSEESGCALRIEGSRPGGRWRREAPLMGIHFPPQPPAC